MSKNWEKYQLYQNFSNSHNLLGTELGLRDEPLEVWWPFKRNIWIRLCCISYEFLLGFISSLRNQRGLVLLDITKNKMAFRRVFLSLCFLAHLTYVLHSISINKKMDEFLKDKEFYTSKSKAHCQLWIQMKMDCIGATAKTEH